MQWIIKNTPAKKFCRAGNSAPLNGLRRPLKEGLPPVSQKNLLKLAFSAPKSRGGL